MPRYDVRMLARWVPQHFGWLEGIFLVGLAGMTLLVGLFAIYVITQQFRNPGRRRD